MCSGVLCTENFAILFIGLARVRYQTVQCSLFEWSLIDRVTLNDQIQDSLFPQIDSVYKLTALRDGDNELVVHSKCIAPEHMQVFGFDYYYYYYYKRV